MSREDPHLDMMIEPEPRSGKTSKREYLLACLAAIFFCLCILFIVLFAVYYVKYANQSQTARSPVSIIPTSMSQVMPTAMSQVTREEKIVPTCTELKERGMTTGNLQLFQLDSERGKENDNPPQYVYCDTRRQNETGGNLGVPKCMKLKAGDTRGILELHMLDPDGKGEKTNPPEYFYCDMSSQDGIGVTVMAHNIKSAVHVSGFEEPQSYRSVLEYDNSFDQIVSLIDQSKQCRQYISWKCRHANIWTTELDQLFTTWLNRSRLPSEYFGGAHPGFEGCACGLNNSCADVGETCNCQSREFVWREDDGYLTYKDDLPVYAFVAGDTGYCREEGYFQIGWLECWGRNTSD